MPNWCDFSMKIVGDPTNIEKFAKYLTNEYDEGFHFWRTFVDELEAEDYNIKEHIINNSLIVNGYCAWSVYSCMFEGAYTYQSEADKEGTGFLGITIPKATKKLSLKVEILSKEPGVGFTEHFIVDNGDIILNKCEDYTECSMDSILDEYEESVEPIENRDCFKCVPDDILSWYCNKTGIELYPIEEGSEWYETPHETNFSI